MSPPATLHIDWDLLCQGYLSGGRLTARFHELRVNGRGGVGGVGGGWTWRLQLGEAPQRFMFVRIPLCLCGCKRKVEGKILCIQGDRSLILFFFLSPSSTLQRVGGGHSDDRRPTFFHKFIQRKKNGHLRVIPRRRRRLLQIAQREERRGETGRKHVLPSFCDAS